MNFSREEATKRMARISKMVATWNALRPNDQAALALHFFSRVREVSLEVHDGK